VIIIDNLVIQKINEKTNEHMNLKYSHDRGTLEIELCKSGRLVYEEVITLPHEVRKLARYLNLVADLMQDQLRD